MANILLIEPDNILANSYSAALSLTGHRVNIAKNAQTAIVQADVIVPDLVITELQLAGHNGIEFLFEFRSYPEWMNIPVVILSMVPQIEFSECASLWLDLNIKSYLYKPATNLRDLIASVNDLASINA